MGTHRPSQWSDDTVPTPHVKSEGGEEHVAAGRVRGVAMWFLAFLAAVLLIALLGLWGLYLLRDQWSSAGPTPTYIIWTPSPAAARIANPTQLPTEPAGEAAVPTVSPGMAAGMSVQVTGTGGSGLNLRSGPGSTAGRMDVALEGEIFVVVAGPEIAGDAEWWQIEDPDDPTRRWWAVANYLVPIE